MCRKLILISMLFSALMACTHKPQDITQNQNPKRAVIVDKVGDNKDGTPDVSSIQYQCVCDCILGNRVLYKDSKTRLSCDYWKGKPCDLHSNGRVQTGKMLNCRSLTGGGSGGNSAKSFISKRNRLCTASEGGGADVILKNNHRSKRIKVFYDYKHEGFSYSRERIIANGGAATVLFCLRGTFKITKAEFN